METISSLEMVTDFISALPEKNKRVEAAARAYQDSLTKPPGSLGRLEELAVFLASWQGNEKPILDLSLIHI